MEGGGEAPPDRRHAAARSVLWRALTEGASLAEPRARERRAALWGGCEEALPLAAHLWPCEEAVGALVVGRSVDGACSLLACVVRVYYVVL